LTATFAANFWCVIRDWLHRYNGLVAAACNLCNAFNFFNGSRRIFKERLIR